MQTPTYLNRITKFDDTTTAATHSELLAQFLGRFRGEGHPKRTARILDEHTYARLSAEVGALVTDRELPGVVPGSPMDDFIRDSVTVAAPLTPYAAKLLLTHTARYVLWCDGQGWPLEANVIWSVRGIDLYSTTANLELQEVTRRNYRTFLLRISEVLMPEEHPERQTPLSTRTTVAPYTEREMASFRDWAGAQNTNLKRDRAMLMLTLCAGAGLRPGELPFVHYDDVIVDDEGILIMVDGREVPLQAEWEEWMLVLLQRRPKGELLWGAVNVHNTSRLASTFTERSFGNPPRADRLRHTWLTHHFTMATPMKELMRAAGITKLQHLHLLLEHVQPRDHADYRRILRGEVQR